MKTQNTQRIFKIIMLVILTAVLTFMITTIAMYNVLGENKVKYIITSSNDSSSIGKKLESYKEFIEEKYLGEINEEEMIESAIKGYVEGLGDVYSEYISPDEMKEYMESTNGKYVGVGIYIASTKTNEIMILAPIKGSPAEEAGLKSGDIITKVDGVAYTGEELSNASSAMKGEEGTKVKIEIQRGEETLEFEIERRTVKVNSIDTDILENDIGYMEITSFDDGTYEEFVEKYNGLKEKNIKGLIIDLRNNGGGIVKESLEIADMMVEKGKTLLITTSKNEGEEVTKASKAKEINIPIVFLVNENTASASEILVAAVKENEENCTIVGTKTYGKGVIQTIYNLLDGGGLKLTTNEYFTPNRNTINKVGIEPDYNVELPDGKTLYEIEENEDTQLQKAVELLR